MLCSLWILSAHGFLALLSGAIAQPATPRLHAHTHTPAIRKLYEITDKAKTRSYPGCKHIHEVHNRTVLADDFFLCPEDVIVTTTGSLGRPAYRKTQESTWGRHVAHAIFDERDFRRPCVVCNYSQMEEYRHFFSDMSPDNDFLSSVSRRCSQQRIAMSYRDTIVHSTELDPAYILMADDDTSIDPVALAIYLQRFKPDNPVYAGIMPNGGAGFILSRKMLEVFRFKVDHTAVHWKLNVNVSTSAVTWQAAATGAASHHLPTFAEKCFNEILGGNMCFYNSDWVVETCVRWAGMYQHKTDETRNGVWSWFHGHAPVECANGLGYITCHHMDPQQQQARYELIRMLRKQIGGGAAAGGGAVQRMRRQLLQVRRMILRRL